MEKHLAMVYNSCINDRAQSYRISKQTKPCQTEYSDSDRTITYTWFNFIFSQCLMRIHRFAGNHSIDRNSGGFLIDFILGHTYRDDQHFLT